MKIFITLLLLTVCALAQTQRPMGQDEWYQQHEFGQPMGLEAEDEFGQDMYQGGQTLEIGQEDEDVMYQQGAAAEEEEEIPMWQGQMEHLIMQGQEEGEAAEMEQGQEEAEAAEIEQGQGSLQERQPGFGGGFRDFRVDFCERSCFRRHRRCAPCARRCVRDCFRFRRHRRGGRGRGRR